MKQPILKGKLEADKGAGTKNLGLPGRRGRANNVAWRAERWMIPRGHFLATERRRAEKGDCDVEVNSLLAFHPRLEAYTAS